MTNLSILHLVGQTYRSTRINNINAKLLLHIQKFKPDLIYIFNLASIFNATIWKNIDLLLK